MDEKKAVNTTDASAKATITARIKGIENKVT
jgi:hypothetical protein